MKRTADTRDSAVAQPRRSSREIGPIGTVSRVVGGAIAIAVPIEVWGATWWDWAAGLVGLPLFAAAAGAAVAAVCGRRASAEPARPGPMGRGAAWGLLVVVLGGATALTYVTPVDGTAIWIFVGTSMLLAAAKGYGGCEVLAFANAITGRRHRIACLLLGPIDAAEAMRGKAPRPAAR